MSLVPNFTADQIIDELERRLKERTEQLAVARAACREVILILEPRLEPGGGPVLPGHARDALAAARKGVGE